MCFLKANKALIRAFIVQSNYFINSLLIYAQNANKAGY